RTPASASFSYPLEGQRVCGVVRQLPDGTTRNEVTLEGAATDENGVHYALAYEDDAGVEIVTHNSRKFAYQADINYFAPLRDALRPLHLEPPGRTGALDQLVNYSGEVQAQLRVYDWSGFVQCTDRSFYLDAAVEG